MTLSNIFSKEFGDPLSFQKKNGNFLSFIHASDIHLGSFQFSNEYRANDFIRAFQEILSSAIIHQVDFIIFCGDIFTCLEFLPNTLTKIANLITDFNNYTKRKIPLITIEGNHDIRKFSRGVKFTKRGQSWLKFLSSLGLIILLDADIDASPEDMFQPYDDATKKGGKIRIKNSLIYGTRYISQNPEEYLLKFKQAIEKEDGYFHIFLQHFGIEGQMENVPGIAYRKMLALKDRVDYLALGHFHKQFIIDDWIYNPGSSEATCSIDSSYQRGIFLVKVLGKKKKVFKLNLNNRTYNWQTIRLPFEFRKRTNLNEFILQKLKLPLGSLKVDIDPGNLKMPILYLILKGKNPCKSCRINEKELRRLICDNFPIVDVKVYQKFTSFETIDKYIAYISNV